MSKKVAYYGIFAALAILMGYVEAIIPMPAPPGIKLGLSNVIVVLCLYTMGVKSAFFISIVRVFISALLFKGFVSMWYALAGATLSFAVMALLFKMKKVSIVGVSAAGGVFHNIGQLIIASILLGRSVVLFMMPMLMVSGVVTGVIIGIIGKYCVEHVKRI
ncbi:MAG: Gx transporter family protein [Firmicutes bacterium]|nr:Gx transporter family protein [Bacillota bacterium]